MTTPTNSDRLREKERQRLYLQIADHLTQIEKVEAEINKLNAEKAETIEVLSWCPSSVSVDRWWKEQAKPLLDKLKGSPDPGPTGGAEYLATDNDDPYAWLKGES